MQYPRIHVSVAKAMLLPGLGMFDWGVMYVLQGGLTCTQRMMTRDEAELALQRTSVEILFVADAAAERAA